MSNTRAIVAAVTAGMVFLATRKTSRPQAPSASQPVHKPFALQSAEEQVHTMEEMKKSCPPPGKVVTFWSPMGTPFVKCEHAPGPSSKDRIRRM